MTVPMLDEAIQLAAAHGAKEVVVGMAHRGRLNVLAHNLGRPYETIFAEFEGASTLEAVTSIPQGGTGDVKYHHGAQGHYRLPNGDSILVNLESNPSHLEFVHPVVLGATRAAQTTRQGPHAHRDTDAAVPIVLHGDAAFPGQGVVAESLNLQAIDGYKVGGALHLLRTTRSASPPTPRTRARPGGPRTSPRATTSRSSTSTPTTWPPASAPCGWPSPSARSSATTSSWTSSATAASATTRPTSPPTRSPRCTRRSSRRSAWPSCRRAPGRAGRRHAGRRRAPAPGRSGTSSRGCTRTSRRRSRPPRTPGQVEQPTGEYQLDRSPSRRGRTAVDAGTLRDAQRRAAHRPRRLHRPPQARQAARAPPQRARRRGRHRLGPRRALAYASLLTEGHPVRLTGQDVERGTFSQRHLVLHDAKTGQTVCPIQTCPGPRLHSSCTTRR